MQCECADRQCSCHTGASACSKKASACMVRVDMEDETGTCMCTGCAVLAHRSGLFRIDIKKFIAATMKR